MSRKFVARKGLIAKEGSTFESGISAQEAWDIRLDNAIVLDSASPETKFLQITIDGTYYTIPLYDFAQGIGTMVLEDTRYPIQFRVR